MRPSTEHKCAHCEAVVTLRGAQVFVPLPCSQCGAVTRARDEIAGYQLHEVLARNGLGVILRAVDGAGMPLAIKLLQPPLVAESTDIEYFASEVWAIARLNHPNCLRIFATGVEQGTAWIAMEWLPHGSLAARIAERGRLREAEVLSIGAQAASALGAAHATGHHHRDLEPNNLVFADARTVKVTDFGQAALFEIAANDLGSIWGRTCYVSPERLRNEPEEAHSDIYSLGAVLFQALAGEPLHGGEPHGQVTLDLIESGTVRVEESIDSLHEKTIQVLNRMLTSEPTHRFQYWSEVVTQLTQAGTLVARRDAPANSASQTPTKKTAPTATPPRRPNSKRPWIAVSLVLLTVSMAIGVFASKRRAHLPRNPVPVAAVTTPLATPSPAPPPTPVATPAVTPLPTERIDWRAWKTTALESSPGTGKASATIIPSEGALRLTGSGTGITGEKDESVFHYRTLEGNWTLTARVLAHDGAAGLSVRASATAGAIGLSLWLTAEGTITAATRRKVDTKPSFVAAVAVPKAGWLRLNRRGANFTAEFSADTKQWRTVAKVDDVPLSSKPVVGFVVWSGAKDRESTAIFDPVSQTVPPRKTTPVSAASPPRSPPPRSGSPPSSPPARVR